jgi:hypothetical protein
VRLPASPVLQAALLPSVEDIVRVGLELAAWVSDSH